MPASQGRMTATCLPAPSRFSSNDSASCAPVKVHANSRLGAFESFFGRAIPMKQHKMVPFRYSAALTLFGGALAGSLVWSLFAAADSPPQTPQGKHGDASAEQQLAELQKLKLEQDVTKAPAGLDPVVWAAYIPEDNKMTPERVELGRKLYFDTRLSQGQHGFLRHLPRRDTRLYRPAGCLRGNQGAERQAERSDDAQRDPAADVLLGRPLAQPGPPGHAADPQSGRDGDARRSNRLEGHQRRSRVSGSLQEGLRPGNELRGRRPGDRGLRADAGLRRLPVPPFPQR